MYLVDIQSNGQNVIFLGLYNFEVVDEAGKPRVVSFRLPSLAQASIYHEVGIQWNINLFELTTIKNSF